MIMEGFHQLCLFLLVIGQTGLLTPIVKARSLATSDHISISDATKSSPSTSQPLPQTEPRLLPSMVTTATSIDVATPPINTDATSHSSSPTGIESSQNIIETTPIAIALTTPSQLPPNYQNQQEVSSTPLSSTLSSTPKPTLEQQSSRTPSNKDKISKGDFVEILSRNSEVDDEKPEVYTREHLQMEIVKLLGAVEKMGKNNNGVQDDVGNDVSNVQGEVKRHPAFRSRVASPDHVDDNNVQVVHRHRHRHHSNRHDSTSSSNENSQDGSDSNDDSDDEDDEDDNNNVGSRVVSSSEEDDTNIIGDDDGASSASSHEDIDDKNDDVISAGGATANKDDDKDQRPHGEHGPPSSDNQNSHTGSDETARSVEDPTPDPFNKIPQAWKDEMDKMTVMELYQVVIEIQAAIKNGPDAGSYVTIGTIHVTITEIRKIKISDICCTF